nr:cell division cycle 20.5, cofactor of apc complex [Quercus suber]
MWELQPDWYSPTRLLSDPTTQYDFPGDRFIPNRSLMDLDQAHCLLTTTTKKVFNPNFNEVYRQKLEDKLTLDSEGRPFRMLVFRGSPKSSRRSIRHIDEMQRQEVEALDYSTKQNQFRKLPNRETRILDAPNIKNDYYLNVMDWGRNNILAIALGSELYLWKSENREVQKLLQVGANDYPTSLAWSGDAKTMAVGYINSKLQIWDAETSKLVQITCMLNPQIRSLEGHNGRVAATGWNGHILTSGSEDKSIINHDVRAPNNLTSRIKLHTQEVCGLKWSSRGNTLASGGNENLIYIWEASKMSSSNFLYRFNDHCAAVKALAWCPYQSDICGLEWNRHHKEILSGHGYGTSEHQNQLCLWRYPSMTKVGDFRRHASRVLHLCQSPDGITAVSAGADETLRFWEVFGPPTVDNSRISDLDSLLSLKTSPLR